MLIDIVNKSLKILFSLNNTFTFKQSFSIHTLLDILTDLRGNPSYKISSILKVFIFLPQVCFIKKVIRLNFERLGLRTNIFYLPFLYNDWDTF